MTLLTQPSTVFSWDASLSSLHGIGEKIAPRFAKLNLHYIHDLLFHWPYRYEDRTHITPIQDIVPEKWVLLQGTIRKTQVIKSAKKRCIVTLQDQSAHIKLIFFHFKTPQLEAWREGTMLRCFGQVKWAGGQFTIVHPEYEILTPQRIPPLPEHLTPIYPIVAGLSQNWLRKTILTAVTHYQRQAYQRESLDDVLSKKFPELSFATALETIHRPNANQNLESLYDKSHPAYQRLIFEELLAHRYALKRIRQSVKVAHIEATKVDHDQIHQFIRNLPFELTEAQQKAWRDIEGDLSLQKPMLRLIQGDVGCGKTVVAALAAMAVVGSGKQVAIMVPTEILAKQHFEHFSDWLKPFNLRCELLVSKFKTKQKRQILENITLGLANVVIGTHAIFQEKVEFQNLGMAIIDEQHRFGVHQRLSLQKKGESARQKSAVHQLIMTATPIPRTLMMGQYAHLDVTVMDGLPPNRQPIKTLTVAQSRRHEVIERISAVCQQKKQVYWVCTLIEESEALQCQAAQIVSEQLQEQLQFPVGLVHGKMPSQQKEQVMQAFYRNEISVLVATTVIEVGVNVPNATSMIIENPERLGLAQLHQLRGRVGRGRDESFCILLYQPPLSPMSRARLQVMRESNDGFVIAEKDLELRGGGEILGDRQTGMAQYKVADLVRDKICLQQVGTWEKQHSKLVDTNTVDRLIDRWCQSLDLAKA